MKTFCTLVLSLNWFICAQIFAQTADDVFADVEVKISEAVAAKSTGIRTLYISLYDASTASARPYGAMKVDLTRDAKGTIYQGKLDTKNVVAMSAGSTPRKLRIKARLDKDGSAGPDAPGDLVGLVEGLTLGSKAVVTIDKAM